MVILQKRKAIVFIDGNNWYHNLKSMIGKPKRVNLEKLSKLICNKFNFDLIDIRYYNSIPDIEVGEEKYYKHMVFLDGIKRGGIKVNTRRLKTIKNGDIKFWVEKGIDVMISADMMNFCLIKGLCDVCILVSGDADFLPAMKLIKEQRKEVISVSVSKGYSRDLRSGDFRYMVLKKEDIETCFGGSDGK